MHIITLPVGELETNCYILYQEGREDAVIIDPGADADMIQKALDSRAVAAVLLTHGHFDHTGALYAFADRPIYIHNQDAAMLSDSHFNFGMMMGDTKKRPSATDSLAEGQVLHLAAIRFTVLHTPGHTRGSVCFKVDEDIFTGDTMFKGDYGRTDLPGGSMEDMRASLRRLFSLKGCTIHPGHGPLDIIR
ncbi:MAG: MBL fold metallo-hydrolase [Clostridiales bacterium]|nr:MBL fold metallo-hydrolase [Clostridiales bacterium]